MGRECRFAYFESSLWLEFQYPEGARENNRPEPAVWGKAISTSAAEAIRVQADSLVENN
jgi:hypothetical protein